MAATTSSPNLLGNAGHESTIHDWEASPAGKEYLDGAKDREQSEKDAAEAQKPVDDIDDVKERAKVAAKEEADAEKAKAKDEADKAKADSKKS